MKLFLYGYGGFGKELLSQLLEFGIVPNQFVFGGFVDDTFVSTDHETMSFSDFERILNSGECIAVAVCIADPYKRNNVVLKLSKYKNISFPSIFLGTCYSLDNLNNKGIIQCKNSIINVGSNIGDFSIICQSAIVGHDCVIGAHSTLYPFAFLAGGVKSGKNVQFGAHCSILQLKSICDNVFVGAGAVVTKNIECPGVYIGIPAFLKK